MPLTLFLALVSGLSAQQAPMLDASNGPFPDAPSKVQDQQQTSSQPGTAQPQAPGPDPQLRDSSVPQQNSATTPAGLEQPTRILYIIPNYRAVSADANVPPLDAKGKFKLFAEDSFDYSTFLYVGALSGIGMAQRTVPQFSDGADSFAKYYYHIFADQAVGNFFTEFALASAFKQDPRYFTLGRGGFLKRTGYALSRLAVTRTDSGGSAINFSEIVGNGAAAGISGLYYPAQYRTWTKTGQRWEEQLALDGVFNVVKEFWPDIRHSVLHQK
ncbi:MAG: hypothetical protein ACLPPV_18520 [Candidatus Korobacteraceae bacterium]